MKYREIYAALAKQRMDVPGFCFFESTVDAADDCIKRASKQCPNTILDFKENGGAFCFERLLHPALTGRLITRTGRLRFAACWSSFRGKS